MGNSPAPYLDWWGALWVMIKLIRIDKEFYINVNEIEALRITPEALTLYMKDGEKHTIEAGGGYYKTARKALGV